MDETTTESTTENRTMNASDLVEGDDVVVNYETTRGNDAEIRGEVTEVRPLGHGYGDAFLTAEDGREYILWGGGEGNLDVKSLKSGRGHTVGRDATVTVQETAVADGGSEKAIHPTEVEFDAYSVAREWEDNDDLTVRVAAQIVHEFTDHVVLRSDGVAADRDVYFESAGVHVEEKAVGVCDRDVAEKHAPAYVALDREDGKVLAVNPAQVFEYTPFDDEDDDVDDLEFDTVEAFAEAVDLEALDDETLERLEARNADLLETDDPYKFPSDAALSAAFRLAREIREEKEARDPRRDDPHFHPDDSEARFGLEITSVSVDAQGLDAPRVTLGLEDGSRWGPRADSEIWSTVEAAFDLEGWEAAASLLGEDLPVVGSRREALEWVRVDRYALENGRPALADDEDDDGDADLELVTDGGQDPGDVPGHGRVGGIDDPVGRHEYGDDPDEIHQAERDAVDPGRTPRLSAQQIREFVENYVAGDPGVLEVKAKPVPDGWDWTVILPVVEDLAPLADLDLEVHRIGAASEAWNGEYAAVVLDLTERDD